MTEETIPAIDWSGFTWPISDTCTCVCGRRFRSHAKAVAGRHGDIGIWSKDPCPTCGRHRLARIESDPEQVVLSKGDSDA